MDRLDERGRIAEEFDLYYASFDPYTDPLLEKLEEIYIEHKDESSFLLKSRMIRMMCETCPVHLFKESPFFFEISSGRGRHTWGGLQSKAGSFLNNKTADLWLTPYSEELKEDRTQGFLWNWNNPVGLDHFCLGYDNILEEGLEGLLRKARYMMETVQEERKRIFLQAAAESLEALICLAGRFHQKALELADSAADEEERKHYLKIAEASGRVPAHRPETFYEALCAVIFCRECIGSVDGIGVSTFGQLDRMLAPFYEADAAAGRITPEEAKQLFHTLLTYTDVRFEVYRGLFETSTTIIIGGCDRNGNVIYNELTRQILNAVLEGRYVNTKINCRISSGHPQEYLEKLARIQTENIPCIVMQNDDVIIPARVKCGQALEDARLYVSGGCHEIVLANTEVNTRADTWINLPRIFLDAMENCPADRWEEFYDGVIGRVKAYIERIVAAKNKYEKFWSEYAPMPLCSATLTGCIESGRDLTEGGTKYASTALSMLGTATFVDSLYSVKHLVWETGRLTLKELWEVLQKNYEGQERLHRYIVNKIPKHGTDDPLLNDFSAKVLKDLSKLHGQKNARGGYYLPAFYPHDVFRHMGYKTKATPDGRKEGTSLSRGCSPSEFIDVTNPLDIISSLKAIDFTDYGESFCVEMTLPRMEPETGIPVITAMIKGFLEKGGSTLQFNLLDRNMLVEAKEHPEEHRSLIVRVCGYSAAFVTLRPEQQDEVISRAIR